MKRVVSMLLAAIMLVSLVACGSNNTNGAGKTDVDSAQTNASGEKTEPGKSDDTQTAAPAEPKILQMNLNTAPANAWSAASSSQASYELQDYIQGKLYATMPIDGKAVLAPQLAASEPVDVNGDGLTWNIAINPDAKWENGEQINADTFLYTYKMALDPTLVFSDSSAIAANQITVVNAVEYYSQGSAASVAWEDVGFKKVDDMTIQVICAAPANANLVMLHFSDRATAPVYEPLFEECLSADKTSSTYGSSQDKIIASGPFKPDTWVDGSVYELAKNENFVCADMVKLDGVTLTVVEDKGTLVQLFEAGEMDYATLDAAGMDKYGDDPRVASVPGRRVYSIEFCSTNTNKPIINNENFRLALFYASNRVELSKLNHLLPATGLVSATAAADTSGTPFRELATKAGYEPENNGYDPELAKEYFNKALQEEGITSVELTLLCNSTMTTRCEYLQENWQSVFGADKFKVNIDSQPSAQAGELRRGWKDNPNSYEITFTQWNTASGDFDPIQALRAYTTTESSRYAPYDDATLNGWFNEANEGSNLLDQNKRNELTLKMEEYLLEHAVVIPLSYEITNCIISDRVILPVEDYNTSLGWGWNYWDIAQ